MNRNDIPFARRFIGGVGCAKLVDIVRVHSRASAWLAVIALGVSTPACGASSGGVEGETGSSAQALASPVAIGGSAGHGLWYFPCANDFQSCVIGGAKYVAYGANGTYIYKAFTNTFTCLPSSFGGVDPVPGVLKTCYFANYAFRVNENASDSVGVGSRDIAYGANGVFNFKSVGAAYTCNNATFGDPIPGVVKACYSALPGFLPEATENGALNNLNNTPVAYGANGHFLWKVFSGSATCSFTTFGSDPAVGIPKSCYLPGFGGFIASENQPYNVGQAATVTYGSGLNGNFLSTGQTVGTCSNAMFGGDPDVGDVKQCYAAIIIP